MSSKQLHFSNDFIHFNLLRWVLFLSVLRKQEECKKKHLPFLTCPTLFVWYWHLSPTFSCIYQHCFQLFILLQYMLHIFYMSGPLFYLVRGFMYLYIYTFIIYHPLSSWQIYAKHLKCKIEPSHNSLPSEAWSTVQYFSTYIYFSV